MIQNRIPFAIGALVLAAASVAQAGVLTVSDTIVGSPTWNRVVANGTNVPVPPISGIGTAVAYDVISFVVDTSGSYDFRLSSPTYDSYSVLYENTFDPTQQFTNVLIANDDLGPDPALSGFSYNLTAGTTYLFIATAFANFDSGAYEFTVRGPGDITLSTPGNNVPEPGALALAGLALLGAAAARRRAA